MLSKVFSEFKQFALRGNVVDMAVGFTVGAAFGTIARSLVDNIIMPPIGLLIGKVDFSNLFLVLKEGQGGIRSFKTLTEAQSAGAVTLNYGLFINSLISFVVVSLAMFVLVRAMNKLWQKEQEKKAKEAVAVEPSEEVRLLQEIRDILEMQARN